MNSLMKSSAPRTFLTLSMLVLLFFPADTCAGTPIDSAMALYQSGVVTYNSNRLATAIDLITSSSTDDATTPEALLIAGLASWRLTLIAFCNNDKKETLTAGKKAITALNKAEAAGAGRYLTAAHRALTYQLLAGLGGFKNGALYGPKSAKELNITASEKKEGYFTRLIDAINTSQAPKFAGGSPEKAADMLITLQKKYPDSTDLTIHLAETYRKLKKFDEARKLLQPVISNQPKNLFARKVLRELPEK